MAPSSSIIPQEKVEGLFAEEAARDTVTQWSALCQRFLDRQRREILGAKPPPEKLEQHRTALKWMLRFGQAIHLAASDPDYPDKDIANELRGRLLQLQHSWRMVHKQMPDLEAEQLLREVFRE